MTHTRTPWIVSKNQECDGYYIETEDKKTAIADLDFGHKEELANAKHIVKCVNAHEKLVESLINILGILKDSVINLDYDQEAMVAKAKQALKEAEEL